MKCRSIVFVMFVVMFFCGCATDIQSLDTFSKLYYDDSPKKAHTFAEKKAISSSNSGLLWVLQSGISSFVADSSDSFKILDTAEALFSKFESEGILSYYSGMVGATLVNDNVLPYRGNIYEGVFLNYYKALSAMQQSNTQVARVEFNRANDRQRRAKEYYNAQITKAMNDEESRFSNNEKARTSITDDSSHKASEIISSKYSNLRKFKAFDGLINPAISYLSGLFFALEGDSKGLDYLKESFGVSNVELISEDMLYFSNDFLRTSGDKGQEVEEDNGGEEHKTYTWIILEEGIQANKTEISFSLPLLTIGGIYHVGLALPQLNNGLSFANIYTIKDVLKEGVDSKSFFNFEELLTTDNIIFTEFEKQLRPITIRAITSASIKLGAQIGISQGLRGVDNGIALLGSLFGSLYSMATTSADLRIARVLPYRILIARIPSDIESSVIFADYAALIRLHFSSCDDLTKDNTKSKKAKRVNKGDLPTHNVCKHRQNILYVRHLRNGVVVKTLFTK